MFKKRLSVILVVLLLFTVHAGAAVTKYDIDVAHSNVGFSIPIMGGLSNVRGKFTDFAVTIVYDDADVTRSSVSATIKTASIDTGIERRDAHLRTADFFDGNFPKLPFSPGELKRRGNN